MTPELDALKQQIDTALAARLPEGSDIAPALVQAMRYATLSGGKRLRPLLLCAACTGFGGRLDDALQPACAVEFMHTYSLVHDDLPAMDDDDLRHGVPSTHLAFGETNAILAGDALQPLAFAMLAHAPGLSDATRLRCMALLADAVGWRGMVGGQVLDTTPDAPLDVERLKALHAAKTGALITVAVQVGAVIAGADAHTFDQATGFAQHVGLAFQVIDDVLDVTQTSETLGKPAGSDAGLNKQTFVTLMGVQGARDTAHGLLQDALGMLREAAPRNSQLEDLARFVIGRDR